MKFICKKDTIFIIGLCWWGLFSLIEFTYNVNSFLINIKYLGLVLIIFAGVLNARNIKISPIKLIIYISIVLFFLINNVFLAKDKSFAEILIILVCSIGYSYNYDYILQNYACIRLLTLITIIGLALIGRLPNNQTIGLRLRYYLGFGWVSFAPFIFLFIVLSFIWINHNKFYVWQALFFLVINQFLYVKTDTKTAYGLTIIAVVMWFLVTKLEKNIKISRLGAILISVFPIFLMVLILYLSFNSYKFNDINNLLSNRLDLGKQGINIFGIKLFGQPYFDVTTGLLHQLNGYYFTVDSALLRYLLHFGIISTVIMLALYQQLIWNLLKRKLYVRSAVIIIIFISAFSDPWFLNLSFNIFWITLNFLFIDFDFRNLGMRRN